MSKEVNAVKELLDFSKSFEKDFTESDIDYSAYETNTVDIELIKPNKFNIAEMEDIEELTLSIKTNGLLTPIIAYSNGNEYILMNGHRRMKAIKNTDIKEVPLIEVEKPSDDLEERKMLLIFNAQRIETEESINKKIVELDELYQLEKEKNPSKKLGSRNSYIAENLGVDISSRTVATKRKELGLTEKGKGGRPPIKATLSNSQKMINLMNKFINDSGLLTSEIKDFEFEVDDEELIREFEMAKGGVINIMETISVKKQ